MSAETPWGRPTWRQPRKRVGTILPMHAAPRRRWWPLWSALAAFLLFAAILALGHGIPL
jgi:hypothetical protein